MFQEMILVDQIESTDTNHLLINRGKTLQLITLISWE